PGKRFFRADRASTRGNASSHYALVHGSWLRCNILCGSLSEAWSFLYSPLWATPLNQKPLPDFFPPRHPWLLRASASLLLLTGRLTLLLKADRCWLEHARSCSTHLCAAGSCCVNTFELRR